MGWEGGQKGQSRPSAGSATSAEGPSWELWQKGHSEAEERPGGEWPPPCGRAGTGGWGMLWCPHPLPGPLARTEPPELVRESRLRAGAHAQTGGGEKAPLTRVGGLGGLAPGLPFLPRLASNTVAQEGWWDPILCENLPWSPQGTTARASPYPLGIPCPSMLAIRGQGSPRQQLGRRGWRPARALQSPPEPSRDAEAEDGGRTGAAPPALLLRAGDSPGTISPRV